MDAIADEMDVFLLDAFGVLNIGETAIPGVPERVAGLQKAGKRVIVVSNAAGFPHSNLMRKYARLGYDFDPDDVITSRKAALAGLGDMSATRWGLMATESLGREDLEHLDITYLAEDPSAYDAAEGYILMRAGHVKYRALTQPRSRISVSISISHQRELPCIWQLRR